jgi:PBP1b-binding outer membrane lipoprotein LpoB
MNKLKIYIKIILCNLIVFSCGAKEVYSDEPSPETNTNNNFEALKQPQNNQNIDPDLNSNMPKIIEDLRMDIKKMEAELNYQTESLNKLEAQTQIWANPFAIYNKEIVLNNGSSVFGKIIYQDQDIMKVETLIGQLIIDRATIVRVVNQVASYSNMNKDKSANQNNNNANDSGIDLIQKQIANLSAHLVLVGDISETKDASGNTILSGEVKNVGNKRADFSKIIFTFRTNWQGDSKSLTAFIEGVTNTFETGISSDNSILPHAVGEFNLVIPSSFGPFIGYNYDIDWSQYDG